MDVGCALIAKPYPRSAAVTANEALSGHGFLHLQLTVNVARTSYRMIHVYDQINLSLQQPQLLLTAKWEIFTCRYCAAFYKHFEILHNLMVQYLEPPGLLAF